MSVCDRCVCVCVCDGCVIGVCMYVCVCVYVHMHACTLVSACVLTVSILGNFLNQFMSNSELSDLNVTCRLAQDPVPTSGGFL